MFTRRFVIAAAAAAVVGVLTPAVCYASAAMIGTYNIQVDAAGNVSVSRASGIFRPVPVQSYKVTDPKSANLLKALAPASVSITGKISGNTFKVSYVSGTATTGSSLNGAVPLYATPGATAAYHVLGNGDRVMIRDARTVGGQTWFQVKSAAPHATNNPWGWVKAANLSYRIYFAFAHPETPGATSSIPQ
jgi:hypothetical protein